MHGSNADLWVVTTPRKRYDLNKKAQDTALRLGLQFAERGENSVERIFADTGARGVYVETDDRPLIQTLSGPFRFHENTSGLRTRDPGARDALLRALEPLPTDIVLDATLGLACDALVVATRLPEGRLVGVESCPIIADMVRRGIENLDIRAAHVRITAGRIEVVRADHLEYMRGCADDAFDLVYFDPMFSETVAKSTAMHRIRTVADERPLTEESLAEARRVARRRIVVKGRRGCFGPLEFSKIVPSGRSVFYGIIDV